MDPLPMRMLSCCCVCCCSLSVHAEPFGSPPAPVPLDLLDLPPGLTHLELRNIDVITAPADLAAAAAAAAGAPAVDLTAAGAFAAAANAAGAPPTAHTISSVSYRDVRPTGEGCDMHAIPAGVWVPAPAAPDEESSIGDSSSSSCRVSSEYGIGSSSVGGSRRSSDAGCGGALGVLQRLESFKLESCRLRAPQLQVGLVRA